MSCPSKSSKTFLMPLGISCQWLGSIALHTDTDAEVAVLGFHFEGPVERAVLSGQGAGVVCLVSVGIVFAVGGDSPAVFQPESGTLQGGSSGHRTDAEGTHSWRPETASGKEVPKRIDCSSRLPAISSISVGEESRVVRKGCRPICDATVGLEPSARVGYWRTVVGKRVIE